jgi:hypothetical protein
VEGKDMQHVAINKGFLFVGLAAITLSLLSSTSAHSEEIVYTEDCTDYQATDWESETGNYGVKWCYDGRPSRFHSFGCDSSTSLFYDDEDEYDVIWIHFGGQGCTSAEINLNYTQATWQGQVDGADSELLYKLSTSNTFECSQSNYTLAEGLNRTWTTLPECYPESHLVNLSLDDQSVYWKFRKGSYNSAMNIDDVQVTLHGCTHGPDQCYTDLEEDFGTQSQSGSVCEDFPESFLSCGGTYHPSTTSAGECGGFGDENMVFGFGSSWSYATLRCIDLTGQQAASLRFNYTKNDQVLGQQLWAGTEMDQIYDALWTAPFAFSGGCQSACVDLADYLGGSKVFLKFLSGSSQPLNSAIDDIMLTLGDGCCVDNDQDGYGASDHPTCTYSGVDCKDDDANKYPGAPEIVDGKDNQCPGDPGYCLVDEGGPLFAGVFPLGGAGTQIHTAPLLYWLAGPHSWFRVRTYVSIGGAFYDVWWLPPPNWWPCSYVYLGTGGWGLWDYIDEGTLVSWKVYGTDGINWSETNWYSFLKAAGGELGEGLGLNSDAGPSECTMLAGAEDELLELGFQTTYDIRVDVFEGELVGFGSESPACTVYDIFEDGSLGYCCDCSTCVR